MGSEVGTSGHYSVEDMMEARTAQLAPNPWLTRQVTVKGSALKATGLLGKERVAKANKR